MQSTQSAFAIAFCAVGAVGLAVAHYQMKRHQIGKVRLISPTAKHVIGLLGIIIGVLIFAAELMLPIGPSGGADWKAGPRGAGSAQSSGTAPGPVDGFSRSMLLVRP
jgi:hypothetical protein